jgi:hypothetical protein
MFPLFGIFALICVWLNCPLVESKSTEITSSTNTTVQLLFGQELGPFQHQVSWRGYPLVPIVKYGPPRELFDSTCPPCMVLEPVCSNGTHQAPLKVEQYSSTSSSWRDVYFQGCSNEGLGTESFITTLVVTSFVGFASLLYGEKNKRRQRIQHRVCRHYHAPRQPLRSHNRIPFIVSSPSKKNPATVRVCVKLGNYKSSLNLSASADWTYVFEVIRSEYSNLGHTPFSLKYRGLI